MLTLPLGALPFSATKSGPGRTILRAHRHAYWHAVPKGKVRDKEICIIKPQNSFVFRAP